MTKASSVPYLLSNQWGHEEQWGHDQGFLCALPPLQVQDRQILLPSLSSLALKRKDLCHLCMWRHIMKLLPLASLTSSWARVLPLRRPNSSFCPSLCWRCTTCPWTPVTSYEDAKMPG